MGQLANTEMRIADPANTDKFGQQLSKWFRAQTGIGAIEIEEANLARQEDVFNYQKALQEQIFQREDNSIFRRVQDLKKAGLSPVLAAGQGARAGQPIQVKAPQQGTSGQQMSQQAFMNYIQMAKAKQDISMTNAQIKAVNAQVKNTEAITNRTNTESAYLSQTLDARIEQSINQNKLLRDTLQHQIDIVRYNKEQNYQKWTQEVNRTNMTSIESKWMDELVTYLSRQTHTDKYGQIIRTNPLILENIAYQTIQDLRKKDTDFFMKQPLPSATFGQVLNIAGSLLGQMLR